MSPAAAFSYVYAADALIASAAAAVMWRHREAPAARPLGLMLVAAAFWAICDAIELQVPSVALKQLVSQVQYIGVIAAAPLFFHAAMVLSGRAGALTPRVRLAVWGIPVASLLLAWTNPWHHWLWTAIRLPAGGSPFSTYEYGWWFWVLTAQHYVLMVLATTAVVRAIRVVSQGFRAAMVMVLASTLLPWIGNFAYNLKLGPWPGLNWLTLSLGVSGWLLVWVVLREGLLELLPHARGALIEMMDDGVVALDRTGRVIFSNRTARDAFALDERALLAAMGTATLAQAPVEWRGEAWVEGRRGHRWLDLRVGPIFDRWGAFAGRIVVARDVTIQKGLEDERERLIDELRDALGRVTQLEGLLPICANCRAVRDDQGYWKSIEDYVASHAPVEFTHAICPDCTVTLYPDLSRKPASQA